MIRRKDVSRRNNIVSGSVSGAVRTNTRLKRQKRKTNSRPQKKINRVVHPDTKRNQNDAARRKQQFKSKSNQSQNITPWGKQKYCAQYNLVHYHITKCGMTTMGNTFKFNWVPDSHVPRTATVICIVRDPIKRFVSGFLCLRKIGFHDGYSLRSLGPAVKNAILQPDLIPAFLEAINQLTRGGAFDSHVQRQCEFIGPSKTIQNIYCGTRSVNNITHLVKLKDLDRTLSVLYPGIKIVRKNDTIFKEDSKRLNKYLQERDDLRNLLERFYAEDRILFENAADFDQVYGQKSRASNVVDDSKGYAV